MKQLKKQGVTYYIIGNDYNGPNKKILEEFINLNTIFKNDIVIMYDWINGLCLIEDQETMEGLEVQPLSALLFTKIISDDNIIEWMTRSGEEDRIYG